MFSGKVAVVDMEFGSADRRLVSATPTAAVHAVRRELVRLGFLAEEMLKASMRHQWTGILSGGDLLNRARQPADSRNRPVCGGGRADEPFGEPSLTLGGYVNTASDIERVGDHAADLTELCEYVQGHNLHFLRRRQWRFEGMFSEIQACIPSLSSRSERG